MQHFFCPLSAVRRRKAIQAIQASESLLVGTCSLRSEGKTGPLWGVDPKGDEVLIGFENNNLTATVAVDWAIAEFQKSPRTESAML